MFLEAEELPAEVNDLNLPQKLYVLMQERDLRRRQRKFFSYFPDTGPLRRELYQKHLEFFAAGDTCQFRGFIAANRVGKTEGAGGFELTCHLTGRYPPWWNGARFSEGVSAWAAGDTKKTVRDIIQTKLMGKYGEFGTGLIPAEDIIKTTPMGGVPEALDSVHVQHYDEDGRPDGSSVLAFKSYDSGRVAFQGTEQDIIWLDEESDEGIRGECVMRLMTTDGLLIETFTPLLGLTPCVLNYMPGGFTDASTIVNEKESQCLVMAGWDDVPHLSQQQKDIILAKTPPYLRDARSKGIPSLGAGAIYPVPESEFVIDDIPVPKHWKKVYGLDVGWNKTACIWGALDPDTDTLYLYAQHYRGQAEPAIHAQAINAKGKWIPGVIDPAARGRSQKDGTQLMQDYIDLGLQLQVAVNAVSAGLDEVWSRLSTGRLKVFRSCKDWLFEYRMYRRDEKGKIVKVNDHLMDATRYMVVSGLAIAKVQPIGAVFSRKSNKSLDKGLGM